MGTWSWTTQTGRFSAVGQPGQPAHFAVEQIGDTTFRVLPDAGFEYAPRGGGPPVAVTSVSLPDTDLASIPVFMSWFASRYGRHTPAALVHDQLVVGGMAAVERRAADDLFLEMMEELDVPPVRRSVLWSGVTFATRFSSGWTARLLTVVWLLAAIAGMAGLVAGVATSHPWWCVAALLAPIPAALLWGPSRRAGVVGGLALPAVAGPALAAYVGYLAYWVVEEGYRRLRTVPPSRDVADEPTPVTFGDL